MSYGDTESKNYVTLEEVEKIIKALVDMWEERIKKGKTRMSFNPEDLAFCIIVLVSCGLRPTEILTPTVSDFDLDNRLLTLHRTKTGFKHCKCSKWDKNKLVSADKKCTICNGRGLRRVAQYTTIWPNVCILLKAYFERRGLGPDDVPFPFYRERLYWYVREATERAGIKIFDVKEGGKIIKNGFVRMFRQSCVRIMRDLKADFELREVKLRHTMKAQKKDVSLRYDSYDINDLRRWDLENIHWPSLDFKVKWNP